MSRVYPMIPDLHKEMRGRSGVERPLALFADPGLCVRVRFVSFGSVR